MSHRTATKQERKAAIRGVAHKPKATPKANTYVLGFFHDNALGRYDRSKGLGPNPHEWRT